MPTDDQNLVRVLKALLAAGVVTCDEVNVYSPGIKQKGWRLTVDSSIIIDGQHAESVLLCNFGGPPE